MRTVLRRIGIGKPPPLRQGVKQTSPDFYVEVATFQRSVEQAALTSRPRLTWRRSPRFCSGREYLQLAGRLRGLPRTMLESKIDEFLRLFSLWDDRHCPVSAYSKGMRQKIRARRS
jgi:hypothetical protein